MGERPSTIMGGAKKRSMAQMEKTQDQPDKGKEESGGQTKKGGKAKTVAEKRPRGLQALDMNDPKYSWDSHLVLSPRLGSILLHHSEQPGLRREDSAEGRQLCGGWRTYETLQWQLLRPQWKR